jgi:hypothetical protein
VSTPQDGWDQDERAALAGVEDQLSTTRARHRHDPSLDLLRAAQAHALPDDVQSRVDEHVAGSAWSRSLLAGIDAGDAPLEADVEQRLLSRIERKASRPRHTTRARWWWPAVAGVALGTVALVAWVTASRSDDGLSRPPATATEASSSPAAPPPTDPTTTPRSPTAPVLLALSAPEVRVSMGSLTWRGASGENALLADLKPAFDAYRQGDYGSADRAFAALEDRYPRTIEVLFYRGVTRLLLDDAPGAIALLDAAEALADPTFTPDVRWYRAIAEQRGGHAAEARARMDVLCREGDASAPRACAARAQLDEAASPRP